MDRAQTITEDTLYRSSTQYQRWSFTPSQLAHQRQTTNIQASARVRAAVQRQRAQRALDPVNTSEGSGVENGGNTPIPVERADREVNCLTAAEEKRLVDTFCERALELGNFLQFPIEVTATGIQFLRRFYLFNSPMTYEPQSISRSTMFVANKAEGHHLSAERYASKIPKTTVDTVLAPEYLIVQALQFNFDVRHPYRALKGGHLELMEMAKGNVGPLPPATQTAGDIQAAMLALPRTADGPPTKMRVAELEKRITDAYGFASHILKNAALLTDSYFLYTPSHIWLAAHLLADQPLTLFYLSTKTSPEHPLYAKLLRTLRACADLLSSHRSFMPEHTTEQDKEAREKKEKEEISVIIRKLKQCRDPDKLDLVKLNQAQKRDTVAEGGLEESKAKRRKVAREEYTKEADAFWGPELPKGDGNGL